MCGVSDLHTQHEVDEVAGSVLRSARLDAILGKLQAWTAKTLQTDARATGPSDPAAFIPYEECMQASDSKYCKGGLIEFALSNVGRVHIDEETRRQILGGIVYPKATLVPMQVRRLNARAKGMNTNDVVGAVISLSKI